MALTKDDIKELLTEQTEALLARFDDRYVKKDVLTKAAGVLVSLVAVVLTAWGTIVGAFRGH